MTAPAMQSARIVEAIASRLADPDLVAATADTPANSVVLASGAVLPWRPGSLGDGYPAVALLFAELATAEPELRYCTHKHLAKALAAEAPPPKPELYYGSGSLAFATHAAASTFGGYAKLLSHLDRTIARQARDQAQSYRALIAAGRPIGEFDGFDVISGPAGYGRYLLSRWQHTRGAELRDALGDVLGLLVAIAIADKPIAKGSWVPAWWVGHNPSSSDRMSGHINLGLAHGVGGPLALLALAWRSGVRVARHRDAISRIVMLLDRYRLEDDAGPYWPNWVATDPGPDALRSRDVWCYGAAGLARALHLAGTALDEKAWCEIAHAALQGAIATADRSPISDYALCHGWAGLLQITLRMAHDAGDPDYYIRAADKLAARIAAGADQDAPFLFSYHHPDQARDLHRPGFLQGAAGIALALHYHAIGHPPATNWDAALLLN